VHQAPPTSEGYVEVFEQGLDILGSVFGFSPEAQQIEIEKQKTKQLSLQLEAARLKGKREGFLGEVGPLGLPWIAWGGAALIGGLYLYQRRAK